jgi:hypothetical protein
MVIVTNVLLMLTLQLNVSRSQYRTLLLLFSILTAGSSAAGAQPIKENSSKPNFNFNTG